MDGNGGSHWCAALENVHYSRGGRQILENLTLKIPGNGARTALLGASGSGKTSVLNILLGLATPTSGEVHLRAACVGFVSSSPLSLPRLSVKETVKFASLFRGGSSRTEQVPLLPADALVPRAPTAAFDLSKMGRLAVAVECVAGGPELLLLDEPTTGLDARQCRTLLRDLKSLDRTVVVTMHQPKHDLLLAYFDHVVVLSPSGSLFFAGSPRELCKAFGGFARTSCISDIDWALENAAQTAAAATPECSLAPVESVATAAPDPTDDRPSTKRLRWRLKPVSWWRRTALIFWREVLSRVRDPFATLAVPAIFLIKGVLLVGVFRDMPQYLSDTSSGSLSLDQFPGVPDAAIVEGVQTWVDAGEAGRLHTKEIPVVASLLLSTDTMRFWDTVPQLLAMDWIDNFFNNWTPATSYGYPILPEEAVFGGDWGNQTVRLSRFLQDGQMLWQEVDWANSTLCEQWTGPALTPNANYWLCYLVQLRDALNGVLTPLELDAALESATTFLATVTGHADWLENGVPPATTSLTAKSSSLTAAESSSLTAAALSAASASRVDWGNLIADLPDLAAIREWLRYTGLHAFIPDESLELLGPLRETLERAVATCDWGRGPETLFCRLAGTLGGLAASGLTFFYGLYASAGVVYDMAGILFFYCLFLGLSSHEYMFAVHRQRALVQSELVKGLYTPSNYLCGRWLADLLFQPLCVLAMGIPLWYGCGFETIARNGCGVSLLLGWLVGAAACGYGYAVACSTSSLRASLLTTPVFFILWLSTAGFLLRDEDLPAWVIPIRALSFQRWGFFAFSRNAFRAGGYVGDLPNEVNLALAGVTGSGFADIVWLLALNVGYRLVALFAVHWAWRGAEI